MTASFTSLPTELLLQILTLAVFSHPTPSCILRVNYSVYTLTLPLLYEHVWFSSTRGMADFAQVDLNNWSGGRSRLSVRVRIRTMSVEKVNEYGVFDALKGVLERTGRWVKIMEDWEDRGLVKWEKNALRQVDLDMLSLCLHSHTRNPRLEAVYEALALVNPTKFIWTGPDPDHHFSTAIVPQATFHLFQALRHWSHLTHLKLTNISFPNFAFSNIVFSHSALGLDIDNAAVPRETTIHMGSSLPHHLKSIYIGQATFVPAELIARIACTSALADDSGSNEGLHEIRLVDVYVGSIWERRMRRGDVERAGVELLQGWWQDVPGRREGEEDKDDRIRSSEEVVLSRIRKVVRCEAKTERIMGGDRVERVGILE